MLLNESFLHENLKNIKLNDTVDILMKDHRFWKVKLKIYLYLFVCKIKQNQIIYNARRNRLSLTRTASPFILHCIGIWVHVLWHAPNWWQSNKRKNRLKSYCIKEECQGTKTNECCDLLILRWKGGISQPLTTCNFSFCFHFYLILINIMCTQIWLEDICRLLPGSVSVAHSISSSKRGQQVK